MATGWPGQLWFAFLTYPEFHAIIIVDKNYTTRQRYFRNERTRMTPAPEKFNVYLFSLSQDKKLSSTTVTCKLDKNRPVSIGRDKSNDIVLNEKRVSRKHALIVWEKNEFILTDFKSRNGTLLNGKKVARQAIKHGDQVRIGPFEFVVQQLSRHDMLKKVMAAQIENPSQSGFFGDLSSLTIDEIVQIINQSQKTGLLAIQSKTIRNGPARLFFQKGEIIHASISGHDGLDAAYTILQMTDGRFEFSIGTEPETRTIHETTMHLLFEAIRLKDEQNRV